VTPWPDITAPILILDQSFAEPAWNLALDECLLEGVDAGVLPDTLRFWESPIPFVVVGSGQAVEEEVDVLHCGIDGVPITRRCSAGGCVLQGPGCLNFALALRYDTLPGSRDLHQSYTLILDTLATALSGGSELVTCAGISDLAVDGRKVSGNAQRRKRNAFLHHGTLLYAPDVRAVTRYIREPADRPDYRGDRSHDAFLGRLPQSPAELRRIVSRAFGAADERDLTAWESELSGKLVREKYSRNAWIRRR